MEGVEQLRVAVRDQFRKLFVARRGQKLRERHRMEFHRRRLADGIPRPARHRKPDERTRRRHVVVRLVFVPVFKRAQRVGAQLDFVEHDQRFAGNDFLVRQSLQAREYALEVRPALEKRRCSGRPVEVDVDEFRVMRPPELLQEPRLAYLSRAAKHQRLAQFAVFPRRKRISRESFHFGSSFEPP